MKKIHMIAALLAMLMPTVLWAGGGGTTTYDYSATVNVTASGNGTVYVGRTNPSSDKTKKTDTQSDSGVEDTSKTYTFYAFAEPDSGYEFTGWTGGADNASSATTPVTVSLSSSTTSKTINLTATFAKVVTFDGTEYVIDENGGDLATLLGTVQAGDKILINKDVTIEKGVSLAIPSDIQVTISSGKKLTVKGSLSIHSDARLVGDGTLAHSWKTITQAADVHVPFPLGTDGVSGTGNGVNTVDGTAGKYLVTSVKEASNVTGSFTCKDEFFVTIDNKASGESYYSKSSTTKPVGVLCTVAREKALNWIVGVSDTIYTDCATLLTASATPSASNTHEVKDTNKLSVLLANAGTVSYSDTANSSSALGFAVDLAGCSLTLNSKSAKSQWNSLKLVRFFNGSVTISQKVMNTNFCVYNMSGTFGYLSGSSYYTAISFYDSPNVKVSWNDMASTTPAGGQNYYGGGTYNTTNAKFQTTPTTKFNTVYWGTFASGMNPTSYLYDTNKVGAEQDPKQSNAWVVYGIMPDPNAGEVKVNGEDTTLVKALANPQAGDVIVLQRDIAIESDVLVSTAASNVRIDLNGWKLTGANAIINNGDLEIIDVNGNGQIDVPVINNGTLLLSSAKYNGLITLNNGFCYFLAGKFNGGVAVASSVADATGVAEVCGGTYATLTYAHGGQNKNLVDLCENGYVKDNAIAPIPVSYVTNPSFASYSLSAFDSTTKSLYTRNAARSGYTREEWIKLCKIKAASELFSGFGVDCAVTFDRAIAANDVSVNAMGLYTFNVDVAISANNWYSALFQAMRNSGQASAPWTYDKILPGGEHDGSISFSLSNKAAQNGTFCLVEMRLATGVRNMSGPKDWSYTEYVTTAERKLVLGAGTSNKAMIRPATGAATFYSTLGAAMNAVADGGTVMLANDCDTALPITKVGTYTFDTMGFAHSSDISVADGLVIKSTTAADSSVKAFIPDAIATTYEVVQTVAKVGDQSFYNLTDAVAVALNSGEVVTLLADTDEAVVLNKGQSLKLALASGVTYDAATKITTTVENFVVGATAASGYTLYKIVYDGDPVQIGTDTYGDLGAALSAAKSGDTVTIIADTELSADGTVPYGATLVIGTGATLTVASGKTLWIDGDATINGAISGTYSKCTKLFYQEGENGEPFCPYKDDDRHNKDDQFVIKYWKTKISTLSSLSGASSHTTIQNGLGEVVYHGANASAFVCSVNKSVAVNHITGVLSSQTSALNAYNAIENMKPQMILLTANGSVSVGSSVNIAKSVAVDCASAYSISFSGKQLCDPDRTWAQNPVTLMLINSTSATAPKVTTSRVVFINCSNTTVGQLNANGTSYMTSVHVYDSKMPSISFASGAQTMTSVGAGVCVFSGGAFSVATSANYHYYGGYYSADPSARLYDSNYVKAQKGDSNKGENANYWYIKPVLPTVYVAQVGSEQFETVQEAVNAAGSNGGTVELLLALATDGLAEPITVAAGKTVTIDLKGLAINAPNGAFINNGTLFLQDTPSGTTPGSVITGTATGKNLIVNNGTLDITYGTYNGNILLNAGTLTTHGGTFTGTLTAASGADPKEVANLRGGDFTQNVTSFLRDGYFQQGGWVGIFHAATATKTTLSGAEAAWRLTFISSADKTLYGKGREGQTSLEDLQKYAELASSLNPYLEYTPEGVAIFDRAVSGGTVSFYGSANNTSLPAQTLDSDVAANGTYRMLIKLLKQNVPTPFTYKQYINDVSALTIGIKSNNSNNNGTVATIELQFWRPDGSTQGEYMTAGLAPLAQARYMLGGKKAAIDRGANRLAYDSLAAAVAAVQNGERILIGADCSENVTLPGVGTFTVDPYGFAFTGSVSIPSTCFLKSQEEVESSATAQGVTSAQAVTYVVALKVAQVGETFYDNLTEAVANANGEVVTLLAATDETITLTAEGQTFTLNKNGIAFDDAKVVTTIENGFVTVASGESGTVYTAVTSIVDASDGNKYNSVDAAIAGVPGNDISVTITANDTEDVTLPQGKTLTVTTAPGVTANLTVTPGDGAFIVESAVEGGAKYESKKITVEMAEPQATVAVTKIEGGTETTVSDPSAINAAIAKLENNHDVPRTDNTDKLDVLDKITVTPTKIVEEVLDSKTIIRSATFDVTPAYNAGQSLAEGQKLKFRLPVDAAATQLAAIVYHGDAQFGIYPVQIYNNEKFVEVDSDAFSPYGYELLDGETANPVAAIGTTGYASLSAAVAAASNGDTITMLADDTVSLTDGSRLTIDKSLTITGPVDTNGEPLYTIYGKSDATGTNNIYIDGSGTVTLSNLKIKDFGNNKGTDGSHAPVYVASSFTGTVNLDNLYISDFNRGGVFLYGGSFNVTDCYIDCSNSRSGAFTKGIEIRNNASGTIEGTTIVNMTSESDESVAGGIEFYGNGDVTVSGCTIESDSMGAIGIGTAGFTDTTTTGTITVEDCEVTVWYAALYATVLGEGLGENGTTIKVKSGDYTADNFAVSALYGTIEIEDGTFAGMIEVGDEDAGESGTLSISGGLFDDEVLEAYCADGYIPAEQDPVTGMYTVKTGTYVARNMDTGTGYETLYAAVRAATDGNTISLLTNVTESITINKSIVLTGDYTITGTLNIDEAATVCMTNVTLDANGVIYALNISGGSTVAMTNVTVGGGQWCNIHLNNGSTLTGAGVTMLGDQIVVAADGQTYTYRGETYEASEAPWGLDVTKVPGQTLNVPYMDIVRGCDSDVVSLADPLTPAGSILFVANMPEDENLDGVTLPERFYSYTVTIDADINFFGGAEKPVTGWTVGNWNEFMDTGATVLVALDENPVDVPVDLTLNEDVDLGTDAFEFRYPNLTIDGDGNTVSGTIKYTDDAGVVSNIVLGTESAPLTLDMTGVTNPIELGSGISVSNVTIQMTAEQATAGTPVIIWDAEGGVDAPANEAGVTVNLVDAGGEPTGDTASLIWDDEMGMAYIGPCEARLTGPTHETPVYTSLANAIELAAASGDTVTLMTNIVNYTGTIDILKSLTIDGAGYTISAAPVPEGGHRNMLSMIGGSTAMLKIHTGAVELKNITLDGDATHAYTYLVDVANTSSSLTTENIRLLNGGELDESGTPGAGYGAGIHLNDAAITVKDGFYACTGGPDDGVFPFTGILPEGDSSVMFDLTEDTDANPTVEIGNDLLLVGMIGAIDPAMAQGILDYMKVPSRFIPYTLTLGDGSAYAFTGASPRTWNEIIDYGKDIMEVSTSLGYTGLDTDSTPVEVGLLTDTVLPDTFTFADTNFTVNGNGNALSGTIEYTDNAGLIENIVMGTEENPLVLDMTGVTQPVEFGAGVSVTNVTIKMTEDQATAGTPVVIWDAAGGVDAPANEAGVTVALVDEQGDPTGDEASLVWDDELGLAYIGPCEARLTGPTHDQPIYTSLSNAIERAEQTGDTVTLMTNIVNYTGTQYIDKSLVIDGAGHSITAAPVPADGHRDVINAWAGSTSMFKIEMGDVTFRNITLDGDATHAYTFLVSADNSSVNLTTENIRLLNGGELCGDTNGEVISAGAGYGAAVHLNNGAHMVVSNGFYACTGGKTDGCFPFTGILVDENGADVKFELTGDPNDPDNVDIGGDLLLVGMPGVFDLDQTQDILDYMKVPTRFIPYTLTLDDGSAYAFTGASPLGWNDIIDYGKEIMDVSTAIGYDGLNKDSTPVEVGLLTDTVLPETFTFADTNFTVNGNGNALAGTIEYTDNAGLIENIVMGTEDVPLVLDVTGVTEPIEFGDSVSVTNVTIKLTEEQATAGTPIIIWDAEGGVSAPENEDGVSVVLVNDQGAATGDTAMLIWDDELGVAYIGPCEARLTGPTHDQPIYTSLSSAIERAEQTGDTVTLMTNIVNYTGTQYIDKSLVIDGAGHSITAAPVPADGHRDVVNAWTGSTSMFKVETGDVTFRNITLDGDTTHAYTFLVSADNSSVTLTTENVRLLNGGELCGDTNGEVISAGAGYGAAVHLNNGAYMVVSNGFYACTGGKTDGCFPFTGILVDENGGDVKFELTGDPNDPANVDIGGDLLLVGMPGVIPADQAQDLLDYMKVPSRFIPYTLTLDNGSAYAFTGASPLGWNDIIDYGKEIMNVSTDLGYQGLDTNSTPVEVGLLTDTVLPETFTFADTNFTVNGNGNALAGTIEYTDNAGLIENIVMGTEDTPLVLDVTGVTEPIELGDGIVVSNVTIQLTEEQAQIGTPIIIWDVDNGVGEPENPEGVSVAVVNAGGEPTGDTAELIWDDEMGMAYIGPCEARLTGDTHELPIYTTLSNAIERAEATGDTVTLMTNVTLTARQTIDKSIVLDLGGHILAATGDAILVDSGVDVLIDGEGAGTITGNVAVASGTLTITNGTYIGHFNKAGGSGAQIAISGGYFSEKVPAKFCATGYVPTDALADPPDAAAPYTVMPGIVYPTGGDSVGLPIPIGWIKDNTDLIAGEVPTAAEMDTMIDNLGQNGDNGEPLWISYALGFDPSSPTSYLRLEGSKAFKEDDVFKLTITGLNVNIPADLDSDTTIGFHLEESVPGGTVWTPRDEECTMVEGKPTFKVEVDQVDGKILRIVADIKTVCK